jgi:hypothetical protein
MLHWTRVRPDIDGDTISCSRLILRVGERTRDPHVDDTAVCVDDAAVAGRDEARTERRRSVPIEPTAHRLEELRLAFQCEGSLRAGEAVAIALSKRERSNRRVAGGRYDRRIIERGL